MTFGAKPAIGDQMTQVTAAKPAETADWWNHARSGVAFPAGDFGDEKNTGPISSTLPTKR